ncbi:4-hydroxy-tetrahydrodipicolinate reductase [Eisenibacter elegans]|jgi:4-hydroxy-tetrahydrodipicolinate reductase|uniref:4-hydroxy-tetrahydrodipicolinate reductase n=1 Tax=Eisenibacter elegans TaxID=997 RepID=UPI0004275E17|nr:4-hydroxy-tetrahydrodipicolinate reductase [Eisenibacter elegans]
MNIILIGYGKMGKMIEQIALQRQHQIIAKIDSPEELAKLSQYKAQNPVAIEFTQPEAAIHNLKACFQAGIPVVSGTTGWLDKRAEVEQVCQAHQGAFFYASNFSIGVNLFFALNEHLAQLMLPYPEYQLSMHEIHHTEKKDAPSGTAITLAEGVMRQNPQKTAWVEGQSAAEHQIPIRSTRQDQVPGTHEVRYESDIDYIEITHVAHSRQGFATGAVVAAEWLQGKQGVFGMADMLRIKA